MGLMLREERESREGGKSARAVKTSRARSAEGDGDSQCMRGKEEGR